MNDLGIIGHGGFAIVNKIEHNGKFYAKKQLTQIDRQSIRRFQREVRILESLHHPNIITVFSSQLDSDPYYYIMPYYPYSLRKIIADNKIPTTEKRISLFMQIINAMMYSHSQCVIHRDLKPENILLDENYSVVISDFGLGRALKSVSSYVTESGIGAGTREYSAPEQLNEGLHNVDERADIYAMGIILKELFTGYPNVGLDNIEDKVIRQIVKQSTQPDPKDRFKNVNEIYGMLKQYSNQLVLLKDQSTYNNLKQLILSGTATKEQKKLYISMNYYSKNNDIIHKFIMDTPIYILEEFYSIDSPKMHSIFIRFIKHICSLSWAFEYTDNIAIKIKDIVEFSKNDELTIISIFYLSLLASNHRRYYVYNIIEKLKNLLKKEDLSFAIALLAQEPINVQELIKQQFDIFNMGI